MLFLTPKKSRFYNETQQNLSKTPNEEDAYGMLSSGNRQNSNRKLKQPHMSPIHSQEPQDFAPRRRESALLMIPAQIPLIQENPDEQEEDEDMKDYLTRKRESLTPKPMPRSKSEDPQEGSKSERLTYKSKRDRLGMTVTPPRSKINFSKWNQEALTEVENWDQDANNEGDDNQRSSVVILFIVLGIFILTGI